VIVDGLLYSVVVRFGGVVVVVRSIGIIVVLDGGTVSCSLICQRDWMLQMS